MKKSILILSGLLVSLNAYAQQSTKPTGLVLEKPVAPTASGVSAVSINSEIELDNAILKLDKEIKTLSETRQKKEDELDKCSKSVKGFKVAGISTLSATGVLAGVNIYQGVQQGKLKDEIRDASVIKAEREKLVQIIKTIQSTRTITMDQMRTLRSNLDKLTEQDKADLRTALTGSKITVNSEREKSEMEDFLKMLDVAGYTVNVNPFVTVGGHCVTPVEILQFSNQIQYLDTPEKCCGEHLVWNDGNNPETRNTKNIRPYPRCELDKAGLEKVLEFVCKNNLRYHNTYDNIYNYTKEAQDLFEEASGKKGTSEKESLAKMKAYCKKLNFNNDYKFINTIEEVKKVDNTFATFTEKYNAMKDKSELVFGDIQFLMWNKDYVKNAKDNAVRTSLKGKKVVLTDNEKKQADPWIKELELELTIEVKESKK